MKNNAANFFKLFLSSKIAFLLVILFLKCFHSNAQSPTISSFSPNSGCINTSTINIIGTNFINVTEVKIGGTNVTSFTVNSPTSITAIVGSGTTGLISITNSNGVGFSVDNFLVNPLQVPSVTINPNNLCAGTSQFLSATAVNGGIAPLYLWYKNNVQQTSILNFTNKTTIDGLASNYVNAVKVSLNGKIYVGTNGGLEISNDGGTSFSHRTTANGLGSNSIYGIFIASDGKIYVGTGNGLSISGDGGNSFVNKIVNSGYAGSYVSNVYVDNSGKIYAATGNGLGISNDGGNTFVTKTTVNGLSQNQTNNVFVSNDGIIYVTCFSGGLNISNDGGNTFTFKTTSDGLGSNYVYNCSVGIDGKIYVATEVGLSISSDGGITFVNRTTLNGLVDNSVRKVFVNTLGEIYAGTIGGLSISKNGGLSFTNYTVTNGLGNNFVLDVAVVSDDKTYVATTGGLSIGKQGVQVNNATVNDIYKVLMQPSIDACSNVLNTEASLTVSPSPVAAVNISAMPNGAICEGTSVTFTAVSSNGGTSPTFQWKKSGVNISGATGTSYTTSSLINNDAISCSMTSNAVCVTNVPVSSQAIKAVVKPLTYSVSILPDILCAGTSPFLTSTYTNGSNNPVISWTKNNVAIPKILSFSNKTTTNGLGNNVIRAIFIGTDGKIYVGTYGGGLSISSDRGNTFVNKTTTNGLGSNYVFGIHQVNGKIYAATSDGLSISSDGGNTFISKTTANGLGYYFVNDVFVTNDNTIYAATGGGVSISTDGGNTFINKTTVNGLGGNGILDIFVGDDGKIYACTENGLGISSDGGNTFVNKTTANGLGSNYINSVEVGNDGKIYVATQGGGLGISSDGGNTFINKTYTNGLRTLYLNDVAVSNDGKIYVGTGGGIYVSNNGGDTFSVIITSIGFSDNFIYKIKTGFDAKIYAGTGGGEGLLIGAEGIKITNATVGDVYGVTMTTSPDVCSNTTSTNALISVTQNTPASLSIASIPSGAICSGTSVTFTATPTNGGTNPTFQWKKGGINISGATSATYTSTTFANNDAITCVMTSNGCATENPLTSNEKIMKVNANVTITPVALCAGTNQLLTATPSQGGTNPTYSWSKNNVVQSSGSTFQVNSAVAGDVYKVIMTPSTGSCAGSVSANASITVNSFLPASVIIVAQPSGAICLGRYVTFKAVPTNGGTAPTYQWQKNGSNISGEISTSYNTNTLVNGDIITCVMTSNACVTGSPATSSGITTVINNSLPTININQNVLCSGTSPLLTATALNSGKSPIFSWTKTNLAQSKSFSFGNRTTSHGLGSDGILSVYTGNNGILYVGTQVGLSISNDGGNSFVNKTTANGLANNYIYDVFVGADGKIYAAANYNSNGGLSISSDGGNSFINKTTANGLGDNTVYRVFVDANNKIYAATAYGLSTSTNGGTSFINKTFGTQFGINTITDVAVDVFGNIYLATVFGVRISKDGGNTFILKTTVDGLASNRVQAIFVGSDGKIYAGTDSGLCVSGDGGNTFSNLGLGDITEICEGPYGKIYASTYSGGLRVANDNNNTIFSSITTSQGIGSNYVRGIHVGTNGIIYAGTNGGLGIGAEGLKVTNATSGDIYKVSVTPSGDACFPNIPEATITVNPILPASVNITSSSTSNIICKGVNVTFTATPTNGGSNPTYQWKKNNVNIVGATNSAYTTNQLKINDIITCVMASNGCSSGSPATSNAFTFTVNPTVTLVSTSLCAGVNQTLTASSPNGGANPSFVWSKNNVIQTTANSYSVTNSVAGDVFKVTLIPSIDACPSTSTVEDSVIIKPNLPTSLTINTIQQGPFCVGQNITLYSTKINGGTNPTYQWKKNGDDILGETKSYITSNSLINTDVISCMMTSNACANQNPVTSIGLNLNFTNLTLPSILLNPTVLCSGTTQSIVATGINGGSFPSYFWSKNNIPQSVVSNFVNKNTDATLDFNYLRGGVFVDSKGKIYGASDIGLVISDDGGNTFTLRTTVNGLGSGGVNSVYVSTDGKIYASTNGGLSISYDGGNSFVNKTTANGLGHNQIWGRVFIGSDGKIYVPNNNGLSISTDGGNSFVNKSASNGLGNGSVRSVFVSADNKIYAATGGNGLSISIDGGNTFFSRTIINGLGDNRLLGVTLNSDGNIFVSTVGGLSLSTNGGNTFVNKTTMDGLGSNFIFGPVEFGVDGKIYVPTENGLAISIDGGNTFINKTTANGLRYNYVYSVQVRPDGKVYVALPGAVSIATQSTSSNFQVTNAVANDIYKVIMSPSQDACPSTPTAFVSTIVNPILPSNVSITSSPTGAICQGSSVTFTATPTNGGTTPTYQWKNNGIAIAGAVNSTYNTNSLQNNDVISCVMTSNATCVSNSTAESTGITMTVISPVPVELSIISAPLGSICLGTSVTFITTPNNGGTTPTYQWKKNNVNIMGETSSTFQSNNLVNNDVISCTMTSNNNCVSNNPITSSGITISVDSPLPASVIIVSSTTEEICEGTSVTFTATPINGGINPIFQWQKNSVNILNENTSTYTTSTLTNDDAIRCVMTSNNNCVSNSPATSTEIIMSVNPMVVAGISVSSLPSGEICAGSGVTFTATTTYGGTSPTYQWQKNGVDILGDTSLIYTSNTLLNNDTIRCVMTSNANCVSNNPANSTDIVITVNQPVPVEVSLTSTLTGPICLSTSVTFTALPTNEGTNPVYQWKKNQNVIIGETNSTYSTTSLIDNDTITCEIQSNRACVLNNLAASNSLISSIITEPSNILISRNAICPGDSVTFSAEITSGELFWYNQPSGGLAVGQGNNFSLKPTSTSNYFVSNETADCQSSRISVGIVNVANPFFTVTWLGLTTDWADFNNWSGGFIPNSCTNVIIEAGILNMPIITGENNFCKSIFVKIGANVYLTEGAKLSVLN